MLDRKDTLPSTEKSNFGLTGISMLSLMREIHFHNTIVVELKQLTSISEIGYFSASHLPTNER